MKILFTIIFFLSSTFAADKTAVTQALAACGPIDIRFDVTTEENQHPLGQPEAGKALVYIVQQGEFECIRCSTTSRMGVDGTWVGANDDESYFYFYVTPGEHHLCTDQQTKSEDHRLAALVPFTAEAGKIYYFRARLLERITRHRGSDEWTLDLDPINPDQGQLLVSLSRFSTWRMKK
ncbi:MAG TPA: DUF2846 domain-containing protein [Candidatus Angelobacter sp.]